MIDSFFILGTSLSFFLGLVRCRPLLLLPYLFPLRVRRPSGAALPGHEPLDKPTVPSTNRTAIQGATPLLSSITVGGPDPPRSRGGFFRLRRKPFGSGRGTWTKSSKATTQWSKGEWSKTEIGVVTAQTWACVEDSTSWAVEVWCLLIGTGRVSEE